MHYDPERHHRRSIRLRGYDYTRAGAYFVTLCTRDRACLFGEVVNGEVRLSDAGRIVAETWTWLAVQYPYVALDAWVVMPNHLHGIIVMVDGDDGGGDDGGGAPSGTGGTPSGAGGAPSGTGGASSGTGGASSGTGGASSGTGGASSGTGGAPSGTGGASSGTGGAPSGTVVVKRKPLGRLIGAFKTVSTKRINEIRATPGATVWQRNYYEHIVRGDADLRRIRAYIANNPARWDRDRNHPRPSSHT